MPRFETIFEMSVKKPEKMSTVKNVLVYVLKHRAKNFNDLSAFFIHRIVLSIIRHFHTVSFCVIFTKKTVPVKNLHFQNHKCTANSSLK